MAHPVAADEPSVSFLHLPYEIRHQIYLDVLEIHPRVERELPGYPARQVMRYVTAPIRPPTLSHRLAPKASNHRPLPASRPLGYIPHSLLRTCKQVYYEARLVLFHTNEFVFTHWMTSATSYCEAVLRSMQPWQREAIRHVRFAMGLEELSGISSCVMPQGRHSQLERVCALLPGVRTMRWNLSCGVFPTEWFVKDDETGHVEIREDWSGAGRRWIDCGLKKLGDLSVLEIECSFLLWMTPSRCSREEKRRADEELALGWCKKVEELLNEGRSSGSLPRVVAVASARESRARAGGTHLADADALTLAYMPSGLGVGFPSPS